MPVSSSFCLLVHCRVVKTLPPGRTQPLQRKLVGVQKGHSMQQALETRVTGERGFSCTVRATHDPESGLAHVAGSSRARSGGLQSVLFGFGKCSHEFRGEFGSLGVHGLLPICQETNKVQRLLLQGGRQGLGLMKNLFRCTHNEKLPSRVYPVTI